MCSYGDIFPISGLGKFVGTFTAISGALTMSLPLPIIVSNFEKWDRNISGAFLMCLLLRYYQKQLLEDQLKERRERLQENRMKEEKERLTALGYTGGEDSQINMETLPETGLSVYG